MTRDADDWTEAESQALRTLAGEEAPPPSAVERTAEALREAGLLGRRTQRRWSWLGAIAATAAAFVGGMLVARPAPPGPPADTRPQFVVLLYGDPSDPAEREREVGEIKAWARGLAKSGHALSGAKLAESEYRLGPDGTETSAGLGGYIVLAADGPEQALAMARTCPHLQHGGRILVRPVDPT
jgi:hypothetical protein